MEILTVMDNGVQEALADESLEGTTAKWVKKEPGITGKSVTVLRERDVVVRSGIAFMPNTIEMAQLKKREKGQFKTNVQFCSKMTEADVKKLLMDTFPYLENQRFYCAAAADNRTRLDFHGQPRIWDGQFIKRKIKGNSALYIFTYEQESGDGLDSKVPEQMTLKRSHDQITSPENEMSEQSLKTGTKRAKTLNVLTGFEVAVRGSSILTGATAEGSQPKLPEKMSQMVPCIYVPVTGQHGMSSVLYPSISATHDTKKGNDIVGSLAPLSQSIPLVLVPDSAVQSGAIPKARISTASDQQSLSKTADGSSNTRQAGLPLVVDKMPQEIHSVLTPVRNNLHISSRSPGQLQKTVNVKKTVLTRDQRAWTTEGRDSSEVRLPVTTTAQGDKSFELVRGAGTGFQQGARIVLSDLPSHATDDQPDSGFSDAEEKGASGNSAAEAAVLSDSGLENTGAPSTNPNTCIQDQNYPSETLPLDWIDTLLQTFAVDDETPQIATDPMLCQIPAGAVITGAENGISSKGVVQNPRIVPSSSGMEGGVEFHIAFRERLAQQVTSGQALFKGVGFAPLSKYSECDLAGIVPPSTKPGIFDVEVFDQTGNYLGTTKFSYRSRAPAPLETVRQVLRDENLGTLFLMLAQKFGSLQVSAGDNNAAQGSGLLNMQDQGRTQQQQSLQFLQLLVYTAAETDAQEFIKIVFSTSAGPIVFNSYKDKTPLPEDLARVNGHRYLAQYLQDVNTRLSKEVSSEVQSDAIDWFELGKAVQTHASAAQDKSIKEEKHPSESDDNLIDYFADSETSSHGSSDLDDSIKSDSDSDSSIEDKKFFGPTQSLSSVDCNNFIGLKTERGGIEGSEDGQETSNGSSKCTSKSGGSAQGPSSSSQNMYMSRLPTIPSTSEYPGDWGFEISFGPLTESASKWATWTYSDVCKKLYVNLSSFCPIKFKTHMTPPPGTVLRAVAVFKGSTNPHDIVKRCPNHMGSSNDGSAPKDQFIRSNNPAAHYHTCPESMRHSVILPYNGPQAGTEYVTEMFAFMCWSSCASGPSRRPVEVIFTLERDGQTLGRRVVEIRVCACPGRDRKSDEKAACGKLSSSQGLGKRSRRGSGNKGFVLIRSGTSSDEDCVVTTSNLEVNEPLMEFECEFLDLQNLDNSLILSTSEDETEQPFSSGSPGSAFKRGIMAIGKSEKERVPRRQQLHQNHWGKNKSKAENFCRTLEDPLEHNEWEKKLSTNLFTVEVEECPLDDQTE